MFNMLLFLNSNFLFILLTHPTMDSIAEMGNGEDSANTKLLKIKKSDNML